MARRALAFTFEERRPGFGIAGRDVVLGEGRRTAQRILDPLTQEVSEVHHLGIGQARARIAALHGVSLLEEGTELGAVAVSQDHKRAEQAGRGVGAARLGAVTGDALGHPHPPATVGRLRIHNRPIRRPDAGARHGGPLALRCRVQQRPAAANASTPTHNFR